MVHGLCLRAGRVNPSAMRAKRDELPRTHEWNGRRPIGGDQPIVPGTSTGAAASIAGVNFSCWAACPHGSAHRYGTALAASATHHRWQSQLSILLSKGFVMNCDCRPRSYGDIYASDEGEREQCRHEETARAGQAAGRWRRTYTRGHATTRVSAALTARTANPTNETNRHRTRHVDGVRARAATTDALPSGASHSKRGEHCDNHGASALRTMTMTYAPASTRATPLARNNPLSPVAARRRGHTDLEETDHARRQLSLWPPRLPLHAQQGGRPVLQ